MCVCMCIYIYIYIHTCIMTKLVVRIISSIMYYDCLS